MIERQHLTLNQLHKSRRIWWIKSVQTLRKWVETDKDHGDLLKTIIVGEGHKKRYYFLPENVDIYIDAIQKNKTVRNGEQTEIF